MEKKYEANQTIKIRVSTHDDLKVLAALRKQSMIETLDRLIKEDLTRVREDKQRGHENV
jgi:hypothetical protein